MGSLRLSLALFVVFFHAQAYSVYAQGLPPLETFLPVPDGRTAVQMFYLISGFYMALVLNEKYKTADTNWLFYSNRFMRLWPAAVIVNLFVILSFLMIDEVRLFGLTASLGEFWALLGSLDPAALAGRIESSGNLGSLFKGRKARYWEVYEKMYAEISDQAENDFHELFSREFARAYKEQLEKL